MLSEFKSNPTMVEMEKKMAEVVEIIKDENKQIAKKADEIKITVSEIKEDTTSIKGQFTKDSLIQKLLAILAGFLIGLIVEYLWTLFLSGYGDEFSGTLDVFCVNETFGMPMLFAAFLMFALFSCCWKYCVVKQGCLEYCCGNCPYVKEQFECGSLNPCRYG
jgi:hypothetical protein